MKLANIFQDHMVIQRNKEVRIFGQGQQGQEVSVVVTGQLTLSDGSKTNELKGQSVTGEDGQWIVTLPSLSSGENMALAVSSQDQTVSLNDILLGEIFALGGQSNMEFWMRYEKHRDQEREYINPNIRFYDVPEVAFPEQQEAFDYSKVGIWRTVDEDNRDYFSAVGYYFAKEMNVDLNVPIGLVGLNWGGTMSVAWMKEETARRVHPIASQIFDQALEASGLSHEEYYKKVLEIPMNDRSNYEWDAFNEFILPRTPSQEELGAFFAGMGDFNLDMMLPEPMKKPGCLYQYMVKTVTPFSMRGVLWYQGESDDIEGQQWKYKEALAALMSDWREAFQEAELPFFIVQLPGYLNWLQVPNMDYTTVRQCQQEAVEQDENAYLCSISDAGEEYDIHPKNKKVVGQRLAKLALQHLFNRDVRGEAPRIREASRDGRTITLIFDNAYDGLSLGSDKLDELHILQNKEEVAYTCQVQGDKLVIELASELGENQPIDIEYARDKFYLVKLYNSEHIPAIPFALSL